MSFDFDIDFEGDGKSDEELLDETLSEDTHEEPEGAPTFGDDMSQRQFRDACEEYSKWAVQHYDTLNDVDLSNVTIEVSGKMVRTAGKAGKAPSRMPTDFMMRFAMGAYDKWGWNDQMQSTIRHELIHIVQYQDKGTGDHGFGFKRMADKLGCEVHCQKFTDYEIGLFCSECEEMIGGRYRECKTTRNPEQYRSKCCKAKLYSENL
jgi:predicted SprT family Zn-dependent metalloprotease